ncbi:transcriptional regulator SUPERMAN-like [Nymphaea colorata]|uniref:C2H2-type domain-containing protein n=1 Tax=Nymphaea colorata TaxID=210225 RepID=A0A5K0YV73_9MAGN|nr:transcriptional regulator SUPERMAN-like [Nymphaea colorata]VVV80924.1 unnamed protein product [Nymphaea colorata]
MAADLSLNRAGQPEPRSGNTQWLWNVHRPADDLDDSWEARAFAEDAGNILGATWPPRSYTCTFCRREFRSAQALGGHMNVHRRDRARLRQLSPASSPVAVPEPAPPSLLFSQPELATSGPGGLCMMYAFPGAGGRASPAFFGPGIAECADSPSPLLPVSHYPPGNPPPSSVQFPPSSLPFPNSQIGFSDLAAIMADRTPKYGSSAFNIEELDLELRLGHKP